MSASLQSIYETVQKRCVDHTKHGAKTVEQQNLVAWRDELILTANTVENASYLWTAAHEAFLARLRFARLNHELQRGVTELYAEEYACRPQVDPETNQMTGSIELHVQYVLKALT